MTDEELILDFSSKEGRRALRNQIQKLELALKEELG
jgi:hypothetical protein